jgi:tetratricopeptide (TPR) repeat protein
MKVERNEPCHCGSGKKYKKCCLLSDQKNAAEARRESVEAREEEQQAEAARQASIIEYDQDLDDLSNQANDLIRARRWSEAEAACRELLDRFPDEIDGHWRSCECFKAKGDFQSAMPHARATLEIAEEGGGFDPRLPARLKKDIARFEHAIATATPGN